MEINCLIRYLIHHNAALSQKCLYRLLCNCANSFSLHCKFRNELHVANRAPLFYVGEGETAFKLAQQTF